MTYEITWQSSDMVPVAAITEAVFFFCIYWFVYSSEKLKKYFGEEGKVRHLLFTKYFGFAVMGVVSFLAASILMPGYSLGDYGISFSKGTTRLTFEWLACICPVLTIMNFISARRENFYRRYPQIRVKEWNAKLLINYCLSWCFYLFGYEFLFRGLLLVPLADSIGVWPAIAANIALYAATHIMNGLDETIGAVPLGLVLCIATLQTGTIWTAFITHVVLALSSNLFAIKFNPEMKISI